MLPTFSDEEIDYNRGTSDFFGLNVNSHVLGDTVLKVPKLEPVLSGKSSKWSCVGGEVRYRGLDIRLIIFYDVILELNVGLASFRFKSI